MMKRVFFILFVGNSFILQACARRLSNQLDELMFQCGEGYKSGNEYILIEDFDSLPEGVVFPIEPGIKVTSKGCIEKPVKDGLIVTDRSRTHGFMIKDKNLKSIRLKALSKNELPSVCDSKINSDGQSFRLKYNQKFTDEFSSLRLHLTLLKSNKKIYSWPERNLLSALEFTFAESISSGEYTLLAEITDRVFGVSSSSTCLLRVDTSTLAVFPANKLDSKIQVGAQSVYLVDRNYSVNFYSPAGMKNIQIEFCLSSTNSDFIANSRSENGGCAKPVNYIKDQTQKIAYGYWELVYRAVRGEVKSEWSRIFLVVENVCGQSDFESGPIGENFRVCTGFEGDLTLSSGLFSDLNFLEGVRFVSGDLTIDGIALTNSRIFSNLLEVTGDLRLVNTGRHLAGFDSLEAVRGKLEVENSALESLDAFSNLSSVDGVLRFSSAPKLSSLAPFEKLHTIGGLHFRNVGVVDLSFLPALTKSQLITLEDNPNLVGLTGLSQVRDLSNLTILNNPKFQSFVGLDFADQMILSIQGLPSLTSLNTLKSERLLALSIVDCSLLNDVKGSFGSIQIANLLVIVGSVSFTDLRDFSFPGSMSKMTITRSNLKSLDGTQTIKAIEYFELQDNVFLKNSKLFPTSI